MLLTLVLLTHLAFAADAPLDPPYRNLVHPESDMELFRTESLGLPVRSDVRRMLSQQSPVKSQQNRGTCSIFSATALMESMLIITGKAQLEVDLSEEWLQYLTTLRSSEEGSTSPDNFRLLRKFGQPSEAQMPYVGTAWTNKSQGLAAKRCGHLPRGRQLKSCLVSHRDPNLLRLSDAELLNPISHLYDPEFVSARLEAFFNREIFFAGGNTEGEGIVRKVSDIHSLLSQGIPVALDISFYNGAWNYPGSAKFGVYRSARLWKQGVVTHPEVGSKDLAYGKTHEEGHSVVVVGYDNDREVEYWMSMEDGSRKKFKRKGVYYFKNSWGASTWGKDFELDGVKYPGYGMILQVNAHSHGQFYRLKIP